MSLPHITPEDYPRLAPLFANQWYQLSIYSLPSILVWSNEHYQPVGLIRDDTLILGARFSADQHIPHLVLPVSPSVEYHPARLHDLAREYGYDRFCFVAENYMNRYDVKEIEALFEIEEQPAFEDYVYYQTDLAFLKGNRYARKRNLIRQFERQYLPAGQAVNHPGSRVMYAPLTAKDARDCIDFLERWCEEQNCDADRNTDLACEWQAVINMITHVEKFDVQGLVLRLDGVVSAFAIASHLTADIGVLHFEKASTRIKGLYQYFDRLCARELFKGYTYINKESDLQMPNLAKAKRSYYPCMRVKSYMLRVKNAW